VDDLEMMGADLFPAKVWMIQYADGTHACFAHFFQGEHTVGVACCSTEGKAILFNEHVQGSPGGTEYLEVTLDEALNIAASKPEVVKCLMLVDDWDNPKIRFVR
jgi:hypothetical protein